MKVTNVAVDVLCVPVTQSYTAAGKQVIEQLRTEVEICSELGLSQSVVVQKITQHRSGGIGQWNPGNFVFHDFNGSR